MRLTNRWWRLLPFRSRWECSCPMLAQLRFVWRTTDLTRSDVRSTAVPFAFHILMCEMERSSKCHFCYSIHSSGWKLVRSTAVLSAFHILLHEMGCSSNCHFYHSVHSAREAMQLETVGLDMLNLDGTKKRDALGFSIPTCEVINAHTHSSIFHILTHLLCTCLFPQMTRMMSLLLPGVWIICNCLTS